MKPTITFTVNNQVISRDEIKKMERSRYDLVYQELMKKGFSPKVNGKAICLESLPKQSLQDLKEGLAQFREDMGRQKILEIYADDLKKGDVMWHDFAQKSAYRKNLKIGEVEVETHGITLEQFLLFNQSLAKKNNLYLPSTIHPEHYYFEAGPHESQIIIERFGQYKYPVFLSLEQPDKDDTFKPVPLDQDTVFTMRGVTRLMSDKSDTKIVGMHQFKQSKDGMKVKLGVYLPEAVPDEMVSGHQWHLMVEFLNGLEAASQITVKWYQKLMLKVVLAVIRKRNRA
ncbi:MULTISPECIES: hypothetical protein [Streptococcus]|uniref:Uncharacterized protein n=1 Tax=Streptococcus pasteurianus (strain ATCC 43144 / JCM 5346 / CCUG 46074 / CDC 1723-81) TaxID=981540 RepID=F5X6Z3_STRPX|nr:MULTISPECIES: hypothetical protein [Streptococcus]MBS5218825.1 hypothetical protein [Streptococcus sp.]BAK30183.1 conserved hypothetical protein [Streptococcus pasteurianus ATCC 43144]